MSADSYIPSRRLSLRRGTLPVGGGSTEALLTTRRPLLQRLLLSDGTIPLSVLDDGGAGNRFQESQEAHYVRAIFSPPPFACHEGQPLGPKGIREHRYEKNTGTKRGSEAV